MQTLHEMLARTYEEDRAREYGHPSWQHAAELRRQRPRRSSAPGTLFAATIGRLRVLPAAADGATCTTADGGTGRLVARFEGSQRVFVCEIA